MLNFNIKVKQRPTRKIVMKYMWIGYWLGAAAGTFATTFISKRPLSHTGVLIIMLIGFLIYEKWWMKDKKWKKINLKKK